MSTQDVVTSPTGCPVSKVGMAFDPIGDEFRRDPQAFFAHARSEDPVFYSPTVDAYVLTRYADINAALLDAETFSAAPAADFVTMPCMAAVQKLLDAGFTPGAGGTVNEDEPAHRVHRDIFRRAFSRERLAYIEKDLAVWIPAYVDRFVKTGRADLVRDFMYEIPALAAFRMIGVPEADVDLVKTFALRTTELNFGWPSEEEQVQLASEMAEFWKYVVRLVDRTYEEPNDSFLSEIIELGKEPEFSEIIDRSLVVMMAAGVLFAGHETTTNGAGNAFLGLLRNPDEWARLCADPSLIPSAVEETLRYHAAAPIWRRRTTRPVTVSGVDIPEGALVFLGFASANRDPEKFEDPDRLDVARENARSHMTFGWGRHKCLGAGLARIELAMAIKEIAERIPHIRLVEGQKLEFTESLVFRGPTHLYAEWDPAQNPRPEDRP